MSDTFKISGKRVELPEAVPGTWKLTARPGGWILAESPTGERRRMMLSEVRSRLSASLGGKLWQGEVTRAQRTASGAAGSDADLVAQFPGKVRKILTQEGALVSEGEPLILVEAMKMEFAIKAPFAGTVIKILVIEAQQLTPGDRFVNMTPTEVKDG